MGGEVTHSRADSTGPARAHVGCPTHKELLAEGHRVKGVEHIRDVRSDDTLAGYGNLGGSGSRGSHSLIRMIGGDCRDDCREAGGRGLGRERETVWKF